MKTNYDLKLKGFVGGWNFDADYTDYILEKYSDRQVNVLIDSTGGRVATAFTIASAFKNHGNVHVHLVGLNASAATIASLGAKKITIDQLAMYMVHKCSAEVFTWADLNADQIEAKCQELQKLKKDLEKLDLTVAAAYSARCKRPKEELHALMAEGGWLTAKEALDWGFVDEITSYEEDAAPVLDEITAKAFVSDGIPLPKVALADGFSLPKESKSFFAKLASLFNSLSNNSATMNSEPKKPEEQQPAAQAKPEPPDAEQKPEAKADPKTDAAESIDAVKAELKKKEAEINDLKKENKRLKAAAPGAEHVAVVESKKTSPLDDFSASCKSARELFNSLPNT